MKYSILLNSNVITKTDNYDIAVLSYEYLCSHCKKYDTIDIIEHKFGEDFDKNIRSHKQYFINIPIHEINGKFIVWCYDIADSFEKALAICKKIGGQKYRGKNFGGGICFPKYTAKWWLSTDLDKILCENKNNNNN